MINKRDFSSLESTFDFSSLETGRDSLSSLTGELRPDSSKDTKDEHKESKDRKLPVDNISFLVASSVNAQAKTNDLVTPSISAPTSSCSASSKKPQENTLISTITARQKAQEIRENWHRDYFDIALKYINASLKDGKLQKDQLTRLKIVLGPEKYWVVFQAKQKLFHLNWEYVRIQSSLAVCNLIQVAINNCRQSLKGAKNLTKTQAEELLNALSISIENWVQVAQKEFEKNNLGKMSAELTGHGYDSGMVNLKFLKVMARHYSSFLQRLKNEALLYSAVVKNFRETGGLETFSKAINNQVSMGKKSAAKIESDIAEQESTISEGNLHQIELDYVKNCEAWIESDIKKHAENKKIYYDDLTPKRYVSEIVQTLSPAPYKYLEVKLSQFVDVSKGNSLLHYSLEIFQGLENEEQREAFLKVIEVLYRHGAIAHTTNYSLETAYDFARIDSAVWRTLSGWRLGLLEMEAAFTYSEAQENVRDILCRYSKGSQGSLRSDFLGWIIGLFEDWHNLKATDRSRDVNEVLKEALFVSLMKLDDEILEKTIVHQKAITSRGDNSKLFKMLTEEVIIPLQQSKLFALKADLPSILDFYKEQLAETKAEIEQLKKREKEQQAELDSHKVQLAELRSSFSHIVRCEVRAVLVSLGYNSPDSDDEKSASISPYDSLLHVSATALASSSSSTSSVSSSSTRSTFGGSFFPTVSSSPSEPNFSLIPMPRS